MSTSETQLATVQEPSISMMLSAFIEKGISPDTVSAFSQLCALKERMDEKQAAKEFSSALAKLQSEMPKIEATKPVPNKDGTVRYKFAPFEEIMRQARPTLTANGFAVTFDNRISEARIVSICTLSHSSGHSRSNEFACRIGNGPPCSNESQADGSASSYAKRFALCNALNIVVEHDDDARAVGSPMDAERVVEIKKRVEALKNHKLDESKFIAWAGGKTYESIPAERYDEIDRVLTGKEKAGGLRNEDGSFRF